MTIKALHRGLHTLFESHRRPVSPPVARQRVDRRKRLLVRLKRFRDPSRVFEDLSTARMPILLPPGTCGDAIHSA